MTILKKVVAVNFLTLRNTFSIHDELKLRKRYDPIFLFYNFQV